MTAVWQILSEGRPVDDLIADLPDEFHSWVRDVATQLLAEVDRRAEQVEATYRTLTASLPPGWTRKDFALAAAPLPDRSALFLRLDARDYRPLLWRETKPPPEWTPSGKTWTEDVA